MQGFPEKVLRSGKSEMRYTWFWGVVCALVAACIGPASAWAGLIASDALAGDKVALPGGGVTTSAPARPDLAKTKSSRASVSAGKIQNDEWFNAIVFGNRMGPGGDMPSPLLGTGLLMGLTLPTLCCFTKTL